ncbi:MAG: transcription antitermination factor NusB [Acidimicrobiales bacterium]
MSTAPVDASRRRSRERALALLYEADVKGEPVSTVVASLAVPPDEYAATLLRAVQAHGEEIDRLLGEVSEGWEVARMAVVDRNVLRLAAAELVAVPSTPTAVVLSEAVELATGYSTDESGRFVNGVLATVASRVRPDPAAR